MSISDDEYDPLAVQPELEEIEFDPAVFDKVPTPRNVPVSSYDTYGSTSYNNYQQESQQSYQYTNQQQYQQPYGYEDNWAQQQQTEYQTHVTPAVSSSAPPPVFHEEPQAPAVDTSAVAQFTMMAHMVAPPTAKTPSPVSRSPPFMTGEGTSQSSNAIPKKSAPLPSFSLGSKPKQASWAFGEQEETKKTLPSTLPTRQRRTIDWNDKGYLMTLITLGLAAHGDKAMEWQNKWIEFTEMRRIPCGEPPTRDTTLNILQEFVEQNLYLCRSAGWADNLMFQDPDETDVPWERITNKQLTDDVHLGPPSDSDSGENQEVIPIVEKKKDRKRRKEIDVQDAESPSTQASEKKARKKKRSGSPRSSGRRATSEPRSQKRRPSPSSSSSSSSSSQSSKEVPLTKEERRKARRAAKEAKKAKKEEKKRQKLLAKQEAAAVEEKKQERARRRRNMIGFSDTERDPEDGEMIVRRGPPTFYHKSTMCQSGKDCKTKKLCINAHTEKELLAPGEAIRKYEKKHGVKVDIKEVEVKVSKQDALRNHPLYKTSVCPYNQPGKICGFGPGCFFAHSRAELRPPKPHVGNGGGIIPAMPPIRAPNPFALQLPNMGMNMMGMQPLAMMNPLMANMVHQQMAMVNQPTESQLEESRGGGPATVTTRKRKQEIADDDL